MSDHLVLFVDRLVRPVPVEPLSQQPAPEPLPPVNELPAGPSSSIDVEDDDDGGEDAPLLQMGECRICQEEDSINNLESPCACSGSLKYAHRKCVQHWCNEKGDTTCEICHKSYEPGYIAPPPRPHPEETTIDIGGGWTISGTPLDLRDPRLLAIAEAERQFFEAEYDGYAASNASGAAFCRSAALILMALLLLRHALSVTDADAEDDPSTFFSLFLLRAAGFLLPCYIMAWAISILQRRRQRQVSCSMKGPILIIRTGPPFSLGRPWLYGYVEHGDEKIIVVEYVGNGSLREHLDGIRGDGLEIGERLDIAIDVAHAITYLHMYTGRHPIEPKKPIEERVTIRWIK